jgi:hypothetical protein
MEKFILGFIYAAACQTETKVWNQYRIDRKDGKPFDDSQMKWMSVNKFLRSAQENYPMIRNPNAF